MNGLGYPYDAGRDGSISDWILDVISVSFHESAEAKTNLLPGLKSMQDIQQAADRFACIPVDPEAALEILQPQHVSGVHLAVLCHHLHLQDSTTVC